MQKVEETIVKLFGEAVTKLPKEVKVALKKAYEKEEGIAKKNLEAILENIEYAEEQGLPLCQDTGIPMIFVKIGRKCQINILELKEAIKVGVKRATEEVPLRSSICDPLTRENTKDNTGEGIPMIDIEFCEGNEVEITVLPKGGGAENWSALAMLKPSDGVEGITNFVINAVKKADGAPCPPCILGIGIGGSSDFAMRLAKRALLRKNPNENKELAQLENEILHKVNALGIGPMGMGGKITALAVRIEKASTHITSLPVSISFNCWCHRKASKRIRL